MSSWVVDKTHIDLLITAGLTFPGQALPGGTLTWIHQDRRRELTRDNADAIGGKLWAENYASVHHTYPDDDTGPDGGLPGPRGFEGVHTLTYTFQAIPGVLDPVVVLKQIACYAYQSCDHDSWPASEAAAITDALRSAAIRVLPGYCDAPWGFSHRLRPTGR
jgi:hypothetical protein